MRHLIAVFGVCVLTIAWIGAQGRPGVVDRPASRAFNGTAVIRGRVVNAETGRPLMRAAVTAVAGSIHRSAITDASGQFEWTDLPAGRYRLRADAIGFVPLDFGEDPEWGGGRDINLSDNEKFVKADFRLPRGGVIAGRIVDEAGEPLQGVQVQAMALENVTGVDRLVAVATPRTMKRTNDVGRYRIFGLQPGDYYVVATTASFNTSQPLNGDAASGYVTTFFPGTQDGASALPVSVGAARETEADFALVASRTFDVSGVVTDASGGPMAGATIVLQPGSGEAEALAATGVAAADGSFSFSGVGPGPHILQAFRPAAPTSSVTFMQQPALFAWTSIVVGPNTPVVVLQGRAGRTARGEIVFEGAPPPSVDAAPATRMATSRPMVDAPVRIVPRPVDFARSPAGRIAGLAAINRDWTFTLSDLWGPLVIDVEPPAGWMLKSVRAGGVDVTDRPVDFDRDPGRLQIVLTNQVTEISGTVTEETHPVPYASVVVFSSDARRWDSGSRFLRLASSDENGRFAVPALPPSEYRAIALRGVRSGNAWKRPRFLEGLIRDSVRVVLHEGEHASAELRLAGR